MNSDEIRKRAKEIANQRCFPSQELKGELDILKLAEDILGKPLDPEFDESKVVHGSVWGNSNSTAVVIRSNDCFTAVCLKADCIYEPGFHWPAWGPSRKEIVEHIKRCHFKYLDQFDFSYPQKHPLFDEAVELLRKWNEWWHDGTKNSVIHPTTIFLTKLGGK